MKDGKEENVITYETFRKFQRQERENENLQKLPEDFFQSCAEWINRKGKVYHETKDTMILKEIENVMSIIKDILDRRERKLLLMAMHAVRSNAVPQNIHSHEEKHFDGIVDHLKNMREKILGVIKEEDKTEKLEKEFKKEVKKVEEEGIKPMVKKPKPPTKTEELEKKEEKKPEDDIHYEKIAVPLIEKKLHEEKKEKEASEEEKPKKEPELIGKEHEAPLPKIVEPPGFKLVKILEEVPKFLGTDGKAYGPFRLDDLVTLEERIAELLVSKKKAEFANI